jgi:excisionase family DNA binding protein
MDDNTTKERYYSPTEVSQLLQVVKPTVLRWLRSGKLLGHKLGHRTIRISESELRRFVEREKRPNDS